MKVIASGYQKANPVANLLHSRAIFKATMNKSELVAKVAHDTRLTRSEAAEVVDATIENIIKSLAEGDEVRIVGFGVFMVSRRQASKARNPKTGKIMKIPAFSRARFKPGKLLKEAVKT
jgi:DNA-binding protein HU-beta